MKTRQVSSLDTSVNNGQSLDTQGLFEKILHLLLLDKLLTLIERLQERIRQLETDLSSLGEAFAMDDQIRSERDYFEGLLWQNGIDPWALPDEQENE